MSRKGVPAPGGSKSKKIPRIFQHRRSASPIQNPGSSTDVVTVAVAPSRIQLFHNQEIICERRKKQKKKKHQEKTSSVINNNHYTPKVEPEDAEDAETVANIEKWLKTRTESISSIDLDTLKSEVEEASGGDDRYLGDELPHTFLGKDNADVLAMDIGLSDKKLALGYDPILQDIRSEKLFEVCEKDDFILPDFHLDQLDSLALTPDDMMVAGEILPSTISQSALNTSTISLGVNTQISQYSHCGKLKAEEKEKRKTSDRSECRIESPKRIVNVYVEAVGHVDVETGSHEMVESVLGKVKEGCSQKPKLKSKLEPRIIKKRRKPLPKGENCSFGTSKSDEQVKAAEGIMAVVAISTDKISNMTQIVINTGKEEQIYQGKTSELIEATGNFPQLSGIQNSCHDNNVVDSSTNSEHDIVISNALEELGITDDSLEPISATEHGKIWVCPKDDCRRHFNRLYALKSHILSHYGIRPFKCDFKGCAWAFYSEFKLKRHKETHLKRKDYICEVENCGRRFTTIYNLLTHKKLHNRPSKIFCHVPNCQERFQTKRALELHMRCHDQRHAPYVCKHEGCEKRYYSSNALTSHQRCHSYKEIDVKCSWPGCGKLFDKPCRLKAHIRSHTGYKPFLCTFQGCNWAFSSSSKLKRHQKKHTNDRKFVCEISSCGKAFMRSEHLKEHRLTHKDGSYFLCHMCDAKFSAKSSLYVHIKRHQTHNAKSSMPNTISIDHEAQASFFQGSQSPKYENTIEIHAANLDENYESNIQEFENQDDSSNLDINLSLEPETETPLALRAHPVSSDDNENLHKSARVAYHCPIDTCTKAYTAKSTLRTHMHRVHGEQKTSKNNDNESCVNSSSGEDYITYTASPESQSTDHMVMIAPQDALVVNSSALEMDPPSSLELESPTFNSILKISEEDSRSLEQCTEEKILQERRVKDHEGCARTNWTYNDFLRARASFNSVVGATDVVLGAAGLVEGLLLPEELPSVYYQDDIGNGECQVLLLDSAPPESTINLCDLE
ncbi:uncharacterized protein LOC105687579 [Athalia rosae]|uniref:uncharacterized protein LOC105687579 n=1 Tax=Athalia rosae TaxID=37344 RepID=UPI002033C7C0|nr:uncharacterized protein LOC105687579 [Athalia rosae]